MQRVRLVVLDLLVTIDQKGSPGVGGCLRVPERIAVPGHICPAQDRRLHNFTSKTAPPFSPLSSFPSLSSVSAVFSQLPEMFFQLCFPGLLIGLISGLVGAAGSFLFEGFFIIFELGRVELCGFVGTVGGGVVERVVAGEEEFVGGGECGIAVAGNLC